MAQDFHLGVPLNWTCASGSGACGTIPECRGKGICKHNYRGAVPIGMPEPPLGGKVPEPTVPQTLQDRQSIYGSPKVNFDRIADLLNVMLADKLKRPLRAVDVAQISICIKMGRLIQTPTHMDSVHDVAGYAECYKQILREESKIYD